MGLLVRKINRSKWPQEDEDNVFNVKSDAITICLKSSSNTLSVWEIEDEQHLDEAVLALASGFQHLESIDVVMLERDKLKKEIECKQTKGSTPVVDLENTHFDLSGLNYYTIGIVAEHIIEKIRTKKIKRYSLGELKKILNNAIDSGRLKREDLKENVLKKIQ